MTDRAGTPGQESDLIDVEALVHAYYELKPDPRSGAAGGVRHQRATAAVQLDDAFNETHIAAITQAIVEYRAAQGITGPLFIGARHPRAVAPGQTTALEVLDGNGVRALVDEFDDYVPTPAAQPRDHPGTTTAAHGPAGEPPTASSSRRATTRPATAASSTTRRTADRPTRDATSWIADRANELIADGLRDVKQAEPSAVETYDFRGTYVDDLANIIDIDAITRSRHPHRRRPAGRRDRRLLGGSSASTTGSTSPSSTRRSTRPGRS